MGPYLVVGACGYGGARRCAQRTSCEVDAIVFPSSTFWFLTPMAGGQPTDLSERGKWQGGRPPAAVLGPHDGGRHDCDRFRHLCRLRQPRLRAVGDAPRCVGHAAGPSVRAGVAHGAAGGSRSARRGARRVPQRSRQQRSGAQASRRCRPSWRSGSRVRTLSDALRAPPQPDVTVAALLVGTSSSTALRALDGSLLGGSAEGISLPAAYSRHGNVFVHWDSKACVVRWLFWRGCDAGNRPLTGRERRKQVGARQLSRLQPAADADVAWSVSMLGADGMPASIVQLVRPTRRRNRCDTRPC